MTYVTEKPSEKRVNVVPVRAKIIASKNGGKKRVLRKGDVAIPNMDDIYYYPGYNKHNPEHEGLGYFIRHTDSEDAPKIAVGELRELLNDDLSRANSIADLLRIVFPNYITTNDFLDAIDVAVETLRNYYGESAMERIVSRFEEVNFFDLKWLLNYGKALNLIGLEVNVFNFDNTLARSSDDGVVRWSMLDNYAVLEMTLDTGATVYYYVTPDYQGGGSIEFKLLRANKEADGYSIYSDADGNIHVVDIRTLFGSFMQYDISYASARYYGEYHRAAMATLGSSGADSTNNLLIGGKFAIAHIDKTLHGNGQGYLEQVVSESSGVKTIAAVVSDVESEKNVNNDLPPAETEQDTQDL